MPNLGASYRRTLAGLRERLSGPGNDVEAMTIARQLIERVVINPGPPRKPPGFTVEGPIAQMLQVGQPGLLAHVAEGIASVVRLSDKERPGARWPLAGGVRGGRSPSRCFLT
jgi:hypothetical protein